jgi:ribonuclease HI
MKVIIYTDGGARGNPGPAGVGAALCDERGEVLKTASRFLGTATNNVAEYEAVLLGLETLKKQFGKNLSGLEVEHRLDSELVCKQLSGFYQIKEAGLGPYFIKVWNWQVANKLRPRFTYIPREQNKLADRLANEAMDLGA